MNSDYDVTRGKKDEFGTWTFGSSKGEFGGEGIYPEDGEPFMSNGDHDAPKDWNTKIAEVKHDAD